MASRFSPVLLSLLFPSLCQLLWADYLLYQNGFPTSHIILRGITTFVIDTSFCISPCPLIITHHALPGLWYRYLTIRSRHCVIAPWKPVIIAHSTPRCQRRQSNYKLVDYPPEQWGSREQKWRDGHQDGENGNPNGVKATNRQRRPR